MAARLPWFPLYVDDYLHDTYDLSACEHGVYLLLLSRFWVSGPLRDNLDALCRVAAGAPPQMVREILERFWELTGQGWVNKRMQIEMQRSQDKQKLRADAAKVRWEKNPTKTTKEPMQMECDPHPHPHKEKTPKPPRGAHSAQKAKKPVNGWEDVAGILEVLNNKTGASFDLRNNKGDYTASAELIRARIDEHGVEACKAVVVSKCDEWSGDDRMASFRRPQTLFAKRNFENYKGQLGQQKQASAQFRPRTREQWERFGNDRGIQARPGESWDDYQTRLQLEMR